eukprot:11154756-Alexandrium_andersonii.AAC.1
MCIRDRHDDVERRLEQILLHARRRADLVAKVLGCDVQDDAAVLVVNTAKVSRVIDVRQTLVIWVDLVVNVDVRPRRVV